ncbi:MAG TPA: hypothetical protein VKL19_09680 [Thermoanaerobaculia bacterium]|nr:hypothetical protein [Thermoanaerobaculia bacterium]
MKSFVLAAFFLVAASLAFSQQIEVPVIDLPYNAAHGLRGPSMQQSLAITGSVYELSHQALWDAFGKREWASKTAVGLFDLATTAVLPLPLTDVWLHEEWHRAVLGRRGINSFDDVYYFRVTDTVAVSHVRDEDLIRLKRDHPADQVRLQEAGIEGEYALVQRLEKDRFFHGSRAWHMPLYWLIKLEAQGYVASGTDDEVNADTDKMNREDGSSVKKRDFTGHDFVGWMYDLSRPDEPYQARGIHPSGVGINRYRKPSDLTDDERRFLHRQGQLQYLNFLDANLIGIDAFHDVNITAAHLLTSFGYTIDANVFLRGKRKVFVVLHDYKNRERHFPGADVQLFDAPLTLRLALWLQPERQRFRDRRGKPGGLFGVRVDRGTTFAEVEAKSRGWVQGIESLEASLALRFGLTFRRRT